VVRPVQFQQGDVCFREIDLECVEPPSRLLRPKNRSGRPDEDGKRGSAITAHLLSYSPHQEPRRRSQGTRRPMSGPSSRRGPDACGVECQDTRTTPSGRSPRRSGWKPTNGLEAGPPGRNARRQAGRRRTGRLRVAPRGSSLGSTSRRQATAASPGRTWTGQRADPPLSAGGVSAGRRPGTTSSRQPRVEGPAEDPVGRGVEGGGEGEEPVQDPGPPHRREARPGGARLPRHYGCGEAGPGRGRRGE